MEISKKQKQIIGIVGVGVGIVGITAIGYYYYLKPKESDNLQEIHKRGIVDPYDELGYDRLEQVRMPKLSRWRNREEMLESGIRDVRENYGDWRDIDSRYEDSQ